MSGWRRTRITIQMYIINLFGVIPRPAFKKSEVNFC